MSENKTYVVLPEGSIEGYKDIDGIGSLEDAIRICEMEAAFYKQPFLVAEDFKDSRAVSQVLYDSSTKKTKEEEPSFKPGDKVILTKQGEPIGWEMKDWTINVGLELHKEYTVKAYEQIKSNFFLTIVEDPGRPFSYSFHPGHFTLKEQVLKNMLKNILRQ